tara:strand:+ start:410 stop:1324 length:915 start_codon:yes stop_codon:yes gene_type:complete
MLFQLIKGDKLLSKTQLAVLYMIASVACFSLMDIIVKYLKDIPFGQVLFMRFAFGMIPILLLIPKNKIFTFYKTNRPGLHAWRAVWGAVAIIALFIGLRNVELADCISLTFLGPVFVTILSALFLGEKIRVTRISAIILGIIGGLIIIRPTFEEFNLFYFMPLIFAFGFAQVALSIKSLSKTEPNYLIAFYFSLLSMLIGLVTVINGWVWPTLYEAILFVILGLAGGYANILLTQSIRMADTGLVTPIKYLSLVFAATAGYFIFDETLKWSTLIGAVFIVAGSYIIFRREETLKKQVVPPRYET